MSKFVLTAQLQLQAPNNTKKIVDQIKRDLGKGVKVPIDVKGAKRAKDSIDKVTDSTKKASDAATNLGRSFGLAAKRFAAFTVASRAVSLFTNTLSNAVEEAIDFERELIKISQVSGKSLRDLSKLNKTIRDLATGLGVSSKELLGVGRILAQAGIQARDLDVALKALAKTQLAPTFEDINQTAEGAVAILAQFGEGVGALERQLGSINAVAGQFAVESSDLIGAIRRTGGVFKAAGGSLEEFLGIFTSVRATTRESSESIATGLRTIFTRIQRPRTIEFLKQLGVNLTDVSGKFVGPFEAVRRLSKALAELPEGDLRFIRISEELGGFRQIGKVIPLLQQFETAERARQAAIEGGNSLTKDAATAQQGLAVQITKVKEEFLELVAGITQTTSFQILVKGSLELAKALIQIGEAIKPLIPLLATLAAFKFAQGFGRFAAGAGSAVRGIQSFDPKRKAQGGKIAAFARGGFVPGRGNRDTVPAMLTPGEFVIKKSSAQKLGAGTLQAMNENRFNSGGLVLQRLDSSKFAGLFARPRGKDSSGRPVSVIPKKADDDVLAAVGAPKSFFIGNTDEERFTDKATSVLKRGISEVVRTLDIGEKTANRADANIINDIGVTDIAGKIFEGVTRAAIGDFRKGEGSKQRFDIPKGLGKEERKTLGALFNSGIKLPDIDFDNKLSENRTNRASLLDKAIAKNYFDEPILLKAFTNNKAKSTKQLLALPRGEKRNIALSGRLRDLQAAKDLLPSRVTDPEEEKLILRGRLTPLINKVNDAIPDTFKFKKPKKKNSGGGISGSGDTVPALLTPGEFVINKGAAKSIGYGNLNRMNKTGVSRFAKGGAVGVQKFKDGGSVGGFSTGAIGLAAFQSVLAGASVAVEKFGDKSLEASDATFRNTVIAERAIQAIQQLAIVTFAVVSVRKKLKSVQEQAIKDQAKREKKADKLADQDIKNKAKIEKQKQKREKAKETVKETKATAQAQKKQLRQKGQFKVDGEVVGGKAGRFKKDSKVGRKVVKAKRAEVENRELKKRNAIDREYLQRTVKTGQGVKDLTKKQKAAYDRLQKNSAAVKKNNETIRKGRTAVENFAKEVDENNQKYNKAKKTLDENSKATERNKKSKDKEKQSTDKAKRSTDKAKQSTDKSKRSTDKDKRSKDKHRRATDKERKATERATREERRLARERRRAGRGGLRGRAAGIGRGVAGAGGIFAAASIGAQQLGGALVEFAQRRQEQSAARNDVSGGIEAARAGALTEEFTRAFTLTGFAELLAVGGKEFGRAAKERANAAAADAGVSIAVAATQQRLEESRKSNAFGDVGGGALVGSIGADLSAASAAVAKLPDGAAKFKKQQELAAQATQVAQAVGTAAVGKSVDELKAKLAGLTRTTTLTDNEIERIARTAKAVAEAQKALNEAQIENLQIQSVFGNAISAVDRFVQGLQTGVSPLQGFIATIKQANNSLGVDATKAIDNVQKSLVNQLKNAGANQSTIDAVQNQGKIAKEVNKFQQSLGPTIKNLKLSTSPTAARAQLEGSLLQGVDLKTEEGRKIADVIRSKVASIPDKEFVGGTVDLSKVTGEINNALGGLTKGFNAAAEAQLAFQNRLTALYKQREKLEEVYAQTLNKAIDTQLEAAKIFEEAGGGKLTNEQQLGARVAQFNNIGGLAGVSLGDGSIADIVRVGDSLGQIVRDQNQQRADAIRIGGIGNPFSGPEGVLDDRTPEARKANEALINFTKQRIGLLKEELDLVKRKNAEEKKSLESLLSGDIEGFIAGQEAAGAAAALATGDRGLASLFGAGALGAGFKALQEQRLGADVEKRAAGISLGAFGITDPNAANVLAGTTPEEEAINAEIRAGARALGNLAGQQAEFARSDIAIQNAVIEAANVQFNQEIARSAAQFSRGGTVYANRGMFVPRGTDTVPAMLTPGEFVVNRQAVQRGNNLQMLRAMNSNGGASAGNNLSGGGQVQYLNDGGIVNAISSVFTNTLPNLQNAFNTFSEAVRNLNTTRLQVQVDPTVVTVNLAGASFLGTMKDQIKDELLKEVGRQIGSSKTNNTGENKPSASVLNEIGPST